MKRRWNKFLWAGFLLVLSGLLTYIPFFALFPITRDFPWVNLSLFLIGAILLAAGLMRAYKQPQLYRGRIFGPILSGLSLLGIGFFVYGVLIAARQIPASGAAPHVGEKAPDFTLPDQNGKPVALSDLLSSPSGATSPKANGALLIFYRGHW